LPRDIKLEINIFVDHIITAMKTFVPINVYPTDINLFLNQKWKATDYYELCCKSELWDCAFLLTLNKAHTSLANEALMYMLERLVIEHEGWDEMQQGAIDANFIAFVLGAGYISNDTGWPITIDAFWKSYQEIKEGICAVDGYEIIKNRAYSNKEALINKEDILDVICFAEHWNNRQYLIESREYWAFFSWATGA
jgi:hypothetical protein